MTALAEAVIGTRSTLERDIGFEEVARSVRLLLLRDLDAAIDLQNERWKTADLAAAQLQLDPGVGQIEVEKVPAGNLHEGPVRSLIEAPPTAFPNVSVMAYVTVPSPSQFDQLDSSDITLFVESMAIAGPVPDGQNLVFEKIVHRRITRMTEAVRSVIEGDPMLLGSAHGLQTPPRGGIGNQSWLRKQDKGSGPSYIWQGSRLQYTVQRHHASL